MTSRQCEIAAEAYTASLLARCGYDVSVQYGANQPDYDLIAVKSDRILLISVKGSQDGGWMLAVKHKKQGVTYHQAIDDWLKRQRTGLVYFLVQYHDTDLNVIPRVYIAHAPEIANHMKTQRNGQGHGALSEGILKPGSKSMYKHALPSAWKLTLGRVHSM